jgi:hypothetical protein
LESVWRFVHVYFFILFFKKETPEEGANRSKSLMYIFTAHKLLHSDKLRRKLNGSLQLTVLLSNVLPRGTNYCENIKVYLAFHKKLHLTQRYRLFVILLTIVSDIMQSTFPVLQFSLGLYRPESSLYPTLQIPVLILSYFVFANN